MQMSEKVGRLGRGLWRLDLTSHESENLTGIRVPLDDLVHDQKKDMTSSVTWPERLEYLNLSLK